MNRARIRAFREAVVERIAIHGDLIVRINLRGFDFGFAIVLVTHPAILAVPVLDGGRAIVEFDV